MNKKSSGSETDGDQITEKNAKRVAMRMTNTLHRIGEEGGRNVTLVMAGYGQNITDAITREMRKDWDTYARNTQLVQISVAEYRGSRSESNLDDIALLKLTMRHNGTLVSNDRMTKNEDEDLFPHVDVDRDVHTEVLWQAPAPAPAQAPAPATATVPVTTPATATATAPATDPHSSDSE
jgi:hypothetical protein